MVKDSASTTSATASQRSLSTKACKDNPGIAAARRARPWTCIRQQLTRLNWRRKELNTVPYKFVPRTLGTICKKIELAIDRKRNRKIHQTHKLSSPSPWKWPTALRHPYNPAIICQTLLYQWRAAREHSKGIHGLCFCLVPLIESSSRCQPAAFVVCCQPHNWEWPHLCLEGGTLPQNGESRLLL